MVRTSGGIRISAGKSAKKSGGGGTGGSGSRSTTSTSSGKSSNKGSSRLPPIPHCEAPSWQKPITSFFNSDASSSKNEYVEIIQDEEAGCSTNEVENTHKNVNGKAFEESKGIIEKNRVQDENNANEDEQPPPEQKNQEEKENENVDTNSSS